MASRALFVLQLRFTTTFAGSEVRRHPVVRG
jgi:hypothetical protein